MLIKRLFVLALASMSILSFSACAKNPTAKTPESKSSTTSSTKEESIPEPKKAAVEVPTTPQGQEAGIWDLIFDDEFEGDTLDESKWNYNYPWGNGHYHNYPAWIVKENVKVENGHLRLVAENKRHPDAPLTPIQADGRSLNFEYTSGTINTQGKLNIDRGYVEASLIVPNSKGFWPAFWMLGEGWPPEIDIMEILTENRSLIHSTFHYGPSWDHKWAHSNTYLASSLFGIDDLSKDFHTYAVEWDDTSMKWYFDGVKLGSTYSNAEWIGKLKDMYILINLGVGGWAQMPDSTTQWPSYYDCDWVRVWQKKSSSSSASN